ncbi:trypco2 family protein [Streptomyces sp. NBC_01750]
MSQEPWAELGETVSAIRAQLQAAISEGDSQSLKFRTGPVELEFSIAVRKKGEAHLPGWKGGRPRAGGRPLRGRPAARRRGRRGATARGPGRRRCRPPASSRPPGPHSPASPAVFPHG